MCDLTVAMAESYPVDWNEEDDDVKEVDVYGFIKELRQAQLDKEQNEKNLVSLSSFVVNSYLTNCYFRMHLLRKLKSRSLKTMNMDFS